MSRMKPNERLELILKVAVSLAEKTHFTALTHVDIARVVECSPGLIKHYLGTVPEMQIRVLRAAIKAGVVSVVEQGQRYGLVTPRGRLRQCAR